jgi:hypothetical protein
MLRREFHACCALGVLSLSQRHLFAAEEKSAERAEEKAKWGDLSATFLYDGEPPPRKELVIDKDKSFYKDPIYDESLVVDAKTKRVANVVAWLSLGKENQPLAIHEYYAKLAKEDVVVETLQGNISQRITLITTEQTLLIRNTEPIGHSYKFDTFRNSVFCDLLPTGGSTKVRLTKPEVRPMPVACSIHPWESGFILARDNPYMAVSTIQGKLRIKNIPVGKHTFLLWHELSGFIKEFKRDGKAEKLDKGGRLTIDIKPGDNNLGEIVFKPERR